MCCPLCSSEVCEEFFEDKHRQYRRCGHCALVYVPRAYHLSEALERAEYEKHENDPEDEGYRRFLARIAEPAKALLPKVSKGLDFGCGPGPTLSVMMAESGHEVALYDKYFYPNEALWLNEYDFVTATEVIEHLRQPGVELERLWSVLKPGGVLAIMSKLVIDQQAFKTWHYKNDPTHICFFSLATLHWLANRWQAKLILHSSDAFSFVKLAT